jgi:glycosyltransferase involved in cell wall biosynthesis
MRKSAKPRIALVWTQFLPYHLDRVAALRARLGERAEVLAVEVASTSKAYGAFAQGSPVAQSGALTLFPGHVFERIHWIRRLWAMLRALAGLRVVCLGIPYRQVDVLLLAWMLRLLGKQVVLMVDSKFDDKPRSAWLELVKRVSLGGYTAAIVAGARSGDYMRFLGFKRRPVLPGCDGLSIGRIRDEAASGARPGAMAFGQRPFVFVGRFVDVKNLSVLLEGYARYCRQVGKNRRCLVLIGSGPLEEGLRQKVADLGLAADVEFAGFLGGAGLAGRMAEGLALILPSYSEPWGLVINEALALGVPVIASNAPGARDILVRNLVNGFVVENGSSEGMAAAMYWLGSDEARWAAMSQAAREMAPLGDCTAFADSIEVLLGFRPLAECAGAQAQLEAMARFRGHAL